MKNIFLPVIGLFLLSLTSCYHTKSSMAYQTADITAKPVNPPTKVILDDDIALTMEGRRIILNGSMSMEVAKVDSAIDQLITIALKNDGYVVRSTFEETTIRVTAGNFKKVIDEVKSLGKLVDQELDGQDITDTYYDLEIRLDNAERTRTRYLELLANVHNINEGLAIERELERLNTQIDQLKGQLKRLDHLETYATLRIKHKQMDEKVKPGALSYVGIGVFKGVKWLFVRN